MTNDESSRAEALNRTDQNMTAATRFGLSSFELPSLDLSFVIRRFRHLVQTTDRFPIDGGLLLALVTFPR